MHNSDLFRQFHLAHINLGAFGISLILTFSIFLYTPYKFSSFIKVWDYHLVILFSSPFYPLLSLDVAWNLLSQFSALKFNPAFPRESHTYTFPESRGQSNLWCVTDFFYFSDTDVQVNRFKWIWTRTYTRRRCIRETHVDEKTENTASVGVGYRRICISLCARIWRHWAPSSPFLPLGVMPSMWVMTTVGNTWSL